MDGQDWAVVTYGKRKNFAVPEPKVAHTVSNAAKIANSHTDSVKLKELGLEARQLMIRQRIAMGMTQLQLNQLCRLPANTIRDAEAGKHVPGQGQLNIINRTLKTNLKLS
jgi:ribosome-binding protein aMBF1 (putative translation factor)